MAREKQEKGKESERGRKAAPKAAAGIERAARAKRTAAAGLLAERREAPEVVERPPARETGAPEFAELSSLSLLDAHEFAEPADVNAFFDTRLPPGTSLEDLPDEEYRRLLREKGEVAKFVARRLVRESVDQILSRPVVSDGVLARALEMHPETQAYKQAIEGAKKEEAALNKELGAIRNARRHVMDALKTLYDAGQREIADSDQMLPRLDRQETVLEGRLEASAALLAQLAEQAEAGKAALDARYRKEMAALAERMGGTIETVAELSPAAIQKDAGGRFRLDIAKLSDEAKEQLGQFLDEISKEAVDAERIPDARQKELNLLLLLETDWMQDFALVHLRNAEPDGSYAGARDFAPSTLRIWSTAMDALRAGDEGRRMDPGVLARFLRTEGHLFEATGTYLRGDRIHVPRFKREMPSVLPLVIDRAKGDPELGKKIFARRGLVEDRLRAVYPDEIWNSAREPVVAQIESIARDFGPKYKEDKDFQALLLGISDAVFHQCSAAQRERVIKGIAPFAGREARGVLQGQIRQQIEGGRGPGFLLDYVDARKRRPDLFELLRIVDKDDALLKWMKESGY